MDSTATTDSIARGIFATNDFEVREQTAISTAERLRIEDAQFDYDRFVNIAVEGSVTARENY
jgi:hypothetical protein